MIFALADPWRLGDCDPHPRGQHPSAAAEAAERQECVPGPEQEAPLTPQAIVAGLKDALGRAEAEIRVSLRLTLCTRFRMPERGCGRAQLMRALIIRFPISRVLFLARCFRLIDEWPLENLIIH